MVGKYDVIIIGAGAAGMMCAISAGRRGRSVLLLDHAKAPGEKIRISGGGRCNFTNIHAGPKNYLSNNPSFCRSALARYTPADFIAMVDRHAIAWHEKTLGQLFCDDSAKQIVAMMLDELAAAGVELRLQAVVSTVAKREGQGYEIQTDNGAMTCQSLVIATGGKSIPKMGATDFAYRVARQFELPLVETRPALVPLTFDAQTLERTAPLSGVSVDAELRSAKAGFREALLFTHRGLSGPSVLQVSSYWREGEEIKVVIAPDIDVAAELRSRRQAGGKIAVSTALAEIVPRRLAQFFCKELAIDGTLAEQTNKSIEALAAAVQDWRIRPAGSEGYRTAEVTLGGVDTRCLNSRTMEVRNLSGLYFIGECVDVTGWLGGFNFQWAWSSGYVAGEVA